jgi:aspartate aminotransferase
MSSEAIADLAPRLAGIVASPASILRRRARELREAGRQIIELSSGNLDFPTPDHVVAAAHAAALRGDTRYTDADGTPELKDAVRATLRRHNDLAYARNEIVICNGSTQALFNALLATLAPGDEVVVPAPYWAPYLDQVRLTGGKPVVAACSQNTCDQNNGFKLRPDQLEAAITARTRWLILNNPVNPSGAVYSSAELSEIAEVLLRHPDVWILCDGLYEHIVFEKARAPALTEIEPRLKSRTLIVSGVAKTYAMMGWRIGYAAGPAALIEAMINIQSQTTSCASSISQAAACAALTGPQDVVCERAAMLRTRRDFFVETINACNGLSCRPPEGTFYLMVSCAGVIGARLEADREIRTDRDFAAYLLEQADLVVVAGEDFGLSPYIRVSFANPLDILQEAGRRLQRACAELIG